MSTTTMMKGGLRVGKGSTSTSISCSCLPFGCVVGGFEALAVVSLSPSKATTAWQGSTVTESHEGHLNRGEYRVGQRHFEGGNMAPKEIQNSNFNKNRVYMSLYQTSSHFFNRVFS